MFFMMMTALRNVLMDPMLFNFLNILMAHSTAPSAQINAICA